VARINIEECWWSDPRRAKLVKLFEGDSQRANGLAVEAWRLAQEFWKHGRKMIPVEQFEALEGGSKLIEAGLAVLRDASVYVKGSSTYLEWVNDKREAGRVGGQKSAEARRKKTGSAQPKPRKHRSSAESEPKHAEPSVSGSFSGSLSASDSGSAISKDAAKPNAGAFIGTYCRAWKERYDARPEITGKEQGIAKRLSGSIGTERASELVESFIRMNDAWFLTKRHDLATFDQNLNAVVQFHDTGKQVTQQQARAAEGVAHAQDQLRRIAEGSL
jgi:hypothetical protein